ncbi:MAG: ABC transporter ATP-binding protein [Symploca sp. SIO2E6]|nr:ABC transporter ATP-binding protein [Symploca sp. SIO2E6]
MPVGKILNIQLQETLHFLPALRLVWQSTPVWTMARVVLLIIQGVLPLGSLYLTKLLVDTITDSFTIADKTIVIREVTLLVVLAGGVVLLTTLSTSLADLVSTAQSQRVTDYMQGIVQAKSIEVDLEYYEDSQYHDTLQRAQEEAPFRPTQILEGLAQLAQNSISLVVMVGLLLSLHWGIAGILFVGAIPAVLVRIKYAQITYHWERERTELGRKAGYFDWLITDSTIAKEIRLFNLGSLFSQRFRQLREQLYQEKLKIHTKLFFTYLTAQALAGILLFAAYGLIIYQTIQGTLSLGDLVLYHQALQRGQNDLKGFLANLSGLYEDNLFLADLYEFLELKPKIIDPQHPKTIPQPMQTGIVFNNVSFQYSGTTRQALKDINFSIRPGETIALVGENGSGKTTLIKLLCRLYSPTSGSITMDGIDLGKFEIAALRRQISVIFQDYVQYDLSAQDNIWLGNIDLPPTNESIAAAASCSGADAVINSLPQGYDTILGTWFEDGEELSIGQWQKVALARAFLRDSQIIVLDEPTSAMDPKAEYEVFKQFRQLIKDQAAILITHRLSTVKMADHIYVMDNGTIVENGTHEELMELGGTYANLFEIQAKNYR